MKIPTEKCLFKFVHRLSKSQCTPLFMLSYRHRGAGAVIHTHSQHAVMATLLWPGTVFRCTHLEMIKVNICNYVSNSSLVLNYIKIKRCSKHLENFYHQSWLDFVRAFYTCFLCSLLWEKQSCEISLNRRHCIFRPSADAVSRKSWRRALGTVLKSLVTGY